MNYSLDLHYSQLMKAGIFRNPQVLSEAEAKAQMSPKIMEYLEYIKVRNPALASVAHICKECGTILICLEDEKTKQILCYAYSTAAKRECYAVIQEEQSAS